MNLAFNPSIAWFFLSLLSALVAVALLTFKNKKPTLLRQRIPKKPKLPPTKLT